MLLPRQISIFPSCHALTSSGTSLYHTCTSDKAPPTPSTPSDHASSKTPFASNQYNHSPHVQLTPPVCHTFYTLDLDLHPPFQSWPEKKLSSQSLLMSYKNRPLHTHPQVASSKPLHIYLSQTSHATSSPKTSPFLPSPSDSSTRSSLIIS